MLKDGSTPCTRRSTAWIPRRIPSKLFADFRILPTAKSWDLCGGARIRPESQACSMSIERLMAVMGRSPAASCAASMRSETRAR